MDEASAQEGIGNRRRATRTILAVDDSRTNLHVLAHRLGQLGYLVVLADRGSQALELISARGFDLVLLDRVMPEVSGLHVLHEIRGTRDTIDLPVIMVTSHDEPGSAVEALQAGADDYLAAPYPFEELAARIERTLSRSDRMEELKRSNLARAIELGEARSELAMARVELERRQRA
jgi:DNA-binding response OmpR family regulator